MTPVLQHMALSLYSTLRDTCMGKNYLASCPEHHTLHYFNNLQPQVWLQASLSLLYGSNPPPLPSIRQRFQKVMTVRLEDATIRRENKKRRKVT